MNPFLVLAVQHSPSFDYCFSVDVVWTVIGVCNKEKMSFEYCWLQVVLWCGDSCGHVILVCTSWFCARRFSVLSGTNQQQRIKLQSTITFLIVLGIQSLTSLIRREQVDYNLIQYLSKQKATRSSTFIDIQITTEVLSLISLQRCSLQGISDEWPPMVPLLQISLFIFCI